VSGGYGQGTGAGFNSLQTAGSPAPPPPPPPSLGRNEPYFDTMTPRNVTALVGKSAYLSCRVRNLGNKTVSEVLTAVILKSFVLWDIMYSPLKFKLCIYLLYADFLLDLFIQLEDGGDVFL
jgi:hypothetical protein